MRPGMGNIGASYKYLRKSPCEAKPYFFALASSNFSFFEGSFETLNLVEFPKIHKRLEFFSWSEKNIVAL
jgi:hypothetical protein